MSTFKASQSLARLLDLMARLRSPCGCPWDADQTPESLRPYLVEETYEVLDAIDRGDSSAIREELGDLLLQIVFQARIFEERGEFDMAAVAEAITAKLIRRHPHVFIEGETGDPATLTARWEQIKAEEKRQKGEKASPLDGIPRQFPALLRARKVADKGRRAGVDGLEPKTLATKATVQWQQLLLEKKSETLGNLLFSLAGLGAVWGLDAEEALRQAVDRFCRDVAVPESIADPPR